VINVFTSSGFPYPTGFIGNVSNSLDDKISLPVHENVQSAFTMSPEIVITNLNPIAQTSSGWVWHACDFQFESKDESLIVAKGELMHFCIQQKAFYGIKDLEYMAEDYTLKTFLNVNESFPIDRAVNATHRVNVNSSHCVQTDLNIIQVNTTHECESYHDKAAMIPKERNASHNQKPDGVVIHLCDFIFENEDVFWETDDEDLWKILSSCEYFPSVFPQRQQILTTLHISNAGFGLIGNLLSFTLFMRIRNKLRSTSITLLALSISDSLVLLELVVLPYVTSKFELLKRSQILCKFPAFFNPVIAGFSSWVLVILAIERLIAVGFPYRASRICTQRNIIVALSIVTIFLCACNLPRAIVIRSIPYFPGSVNFKCSLGRANGLLRLLLPWVYLFVNWLIPFTVLFGSNVFIIVKLFKHRNKMSHLSSHSDYPNHTKHITLMLIAVSLFYLLTTSPYHLFGLVDEHLLKKVTLEHQKEQLKVSHWLFYLHSMNYSCNFILYCLSGSKFRKELKSCFQCGKLTPGT